MADQDPIDCSPLARVIHRIQQEADDRFIHRMIKVLPDEHESLPYVLAGYELPRYSADVYQRYRIECPTHIRNSVPKRQAEFFAGRACARTMLELYGQGQHTVTIGPHREPIWPQGFIGSITHNGSYAAAVACPANKFIGIGIDIESVVSTDARHAMMDLVVSPEELECMRTEGVDFDFDTLLTLVFSSKESFFKAAFSQAKTYFDFDALKLIRIDAQRRVLYFESMFALSRKLGKGLQYQAHFDFLGNASLFTVVVIRDHPEKTDSVNFDSSSLNLLAV